MSGLRLFCLVLGTVLSTTALGWSDPVTTAEVALEGRRYVSVQSEVLELLIAPHRGGQIVSVIHRPSGLEIGTTGGRENGLFSDHDLKQPHPGELMGAPYEVDWSPDRPGEVRLSRRAEGGWRAEIAPTLAGLVYEKTYTIDPLAPLIRMDLQVRNASGEDRLLDYWLQSIARLGESGERNYYFRPSTTGVSVVSSDSFGGREFVTDPVAGWIAAVNRERGLAWVFLADFDCLERLYNCATAYTSEFMYQRLPLPPGQSWETAVSARVVEGMDGVSYASERLIAATDIETGRDHLRLTHRLAAFSAPLHEVRVETALRNVATQQEIAAPALVLPELGLGTTPLTLEFDLTDSGLFALSVTVFSREGVDRWELPVRPFADDSQTYRQAAPPQRMILPRPDNLPQLWAEAREEPAGLLQVGDAAFAGDWSLAQIAGAIGLAHTTAAYTPAATWRPASLHPFPISHRELFRYDLVVLANADAGALRQYGCEMLRDYVELGGGLLLLGGYYSLGKGALDTSPLAALLPVQPLGPWDLRPATGEPPALTAQALPFLAGLPWGEAPWVPWYQEVSAAPGSMVSLTLDGRPLLTTGSFGRGRVAVLNASVLADPDRDPVRPGLTAWSGYPDFMSGLLKWLRGE